MPKLPTKTEQQNLIALQLPNGRNEGGALDKPSVLALCIAFFVFELSTCVGVAAQDQTLSSSKQFYLYGADLDTRGQFATLAEAVKSDFLGLIDEADRWKLPIHLHFRAPRTDAATDGPLIRSQAFLDGPRHFSLRIDSILESGFDEELWRERVIEMLLMEFVISTNVEKALNEPERLKIPPWLVKGVSSAPSLQGKSRNRKIYRNLLQRGLVMTIPDILSAKGANGPALEREIFRVSAAGLVFALSRQPEGKKQLGQMIRKLATFEGTDEALLFASFASIGDTPERLQKWWMLELATMSEPGALERMTISETEAALQEALILTIPEVESTEEERSRLSKLLERGLLRRKQTGSEPAEQSATEGAAPTYLTIPVEEFAQVLKLPQGDRRRFLNSNLGRLIQLSSRAFPLHQPIIEEYKSSLERIIDGKTKNLDRDLARLAIKREGLLATAREMSDLLNFHEANHPSPDDSFAAYRRWVKEREKQKEAMRSTDPISQYLDLVEREFADQ